MSAAGGGDCLHSFKVAMVSALIALSSSFAAPVKAEPATAGSSTEQSLMGDGTRTMEELRDHASTIAEILDAASARVELLAKDETASPALMEAIRQELSLSRRWNRHLGTILDDVAEARRALGAREREAAKEITRLTAAAEEARLELMALKKVLKGSPDEPVQDQDTWQEGRVDGENPGQGDWESDALQDARAMLSAMQDSQKSVSRDVDAVRTKIIEALQTLNSVRGDLPARRDTDGAVLSSEDVTAWAARTAARLGSANRIVAK